MNGDTSVRAQDAFDDLSRLEIFDKHALANRSVGHEFTIRDQ